MAQKKDRSRFTIKFRENDPTHDMTIRILENQGQRNIAPFLVNAVLHYVQCSETPDMSHMLVENPHPVLDRNAIEDIVWGILRQEGIINEESKLQRENETFTELSIIQDKIAEIPEESIKMQNEVNEDMRAMIVRTLSAFRSE